ncbi:MAG: PIN domain-containing protein [Candidatus Woesearchaeota archaeon]
MKGMMSIRFFADTYALIEIIKGNLNYKVYLDFDLVTTKFNLIELYYHCLNHHSVEDADKYLNIYSPFALPIVDSAIKLGMEFKLKYKKEKLSYVDCVGYAMASVLGIKFLTGDRQFATKENVEFVK